MGRLSIVEEKDMMMMAVVATIVMIVMTSHHSLPIRIDQKGTCLGKTQTQAAAIARVVEERRVRREPWEP